MLRICINKYNWLLTHPFACVIRQVVKGHEDKIHFVDNFSYMDKQFVETKDRL